MEPQLALASVHPKHEFIHHNGEGGPGVLLVAELRVEREYRDIAVPAWIPAEHEQLHLRELQYWVLPEPVRVHAMLGVSEQAGKLLLHRDEHIELVQLCLQLLLQ